MSCVKQRELRKQVGTGEEKIGAREQLKWIDGEGKRREWRTKGWGEREREVKHRTRIGRLENNNKLGDRNY